MSNDAETCPIFRRVGVLTGGGDCPGLNAVIRAVTMGCLNADLEVMGIEDGFLGLAENRVRPLTVGDVGSILNVGGTILGSNNKFNPRRAVVGKKPDGTLEHRDMMELCTNTLKVHGIEAVFVIGGDGTLTIANDFSSAGIPCIGIPKTIDNDLVGTDITFGFMTAVATATDAIDRVRTTAASHHRVMVVEVMGRNAGWIALHAGVAGAAHVILLPEIPFDTDAVARHVAARRRRGRRHSIICVAEGAKPIGGEKIIARVDPTSPDPIRLGGIGKFVADAIEKYTELESRYVVLGHVQRGGTPLPADRVLSTQFGHHAMCLLAQGRWNRMVALQGGKLTDVPITEPAGKQRLVTIDDPLIAAARTVGTFFGEGA
ncbi:MAG: ATP-dependent 6-phosphofructokinase [Planctomycetota bacterium]|nr:ATP-dependent 6-phosphofructokinase [Planctomycetota bacterium]